MLFLASVTNAGQNMPMMSASVKASCYVRRGEDPYSDRKPFPHQSLTSSYASGEAVAQKGERDPNKIQMH